MAALMRGRSTPERATATLRRVGACCAVVLLAANLSSIVSRAAAQAPAAPAAEPRARVEARSAELLAVGTVQGNRMAIHLSRVVDNAPVGNAVLAVMLRGSTHPAVAETDGSYAIETPDLSLPGPAAVEFLVTWDERREELTGTLTPLGDKAAADDKGSARQLGWWVLNFAACAAFLWLWSRRKRKPDGAPGSADE